MAEPRRISVTGRTKVVGVIGWPVEHSLSPPMHNAEFERLGLDWIYVPFPIAPENLANAIRGMTASGVVGFNATIPHKQALLDLLDEVSPEARAVGAVNTVSVTAEGKLVGDNTDVRGWVADIQRDIVLDQQSICILGAGGAARSIAAGAAGAGAKKILILSRRPEKAKALADSMSVGFPAIEFSSGGTLEDARAAEEFAESEIVVNATPAGMAGNEEAPIDLSRLSEGRYVYDSVYVPAETPLLKAARECGCAVRNGVGMLANQGALAFEIWTGQKPDVDRMEVTILRQLSERG